MNQKNLRVKKLVERGVTNVARIARKLGFGNPPTPQGIDRVLDALKSLKIEVTEGENGPEVLMKNLQGLEVDTVFIDEAEEIQQDS